MTQSIIKYFSNNQFVAALLFLGIAWFLFEIKGIVIMLFISFIIMASLAPFVDFLKSKKIPHALAVIIPFITTLFLLILLILPLIPFFISQMQSLFNSFPSYLHQASSLVGVQIDTSELKSVIASDVESLGKNALVLTSKVFGGLFSVLTVLVISFYLLIDRDRIKNGLTLLFPASSQKKAHTTLTLIEAKLGAWVRGQLVLSIAIGLFTWIWLSLLQLPFALPLALLAGMLEIVPTIGPILSAIPAVIVALSISPTTALLIIAVYILTQMLENNILVPKIMEKAVGLNPIIIILGVTIGANLLGVIGALLSVPFTSTLIIIYRNIHRKEDKI